MPDSRHTSGSGPTPPDEDGKTRLRRTLRRARRDVDAPTASSAARTCAQHLGASPLWQACQRIALYLPNDGELDTAPIAALAASGGARSLFLPRVSGPALEFAPWHPGDPLVTSHFGIDEPASAAVDAEQIDLFLLPLVGFAEGGVRLGMGGGYYDRYFGAIAPARRPWLIGLAYALQRSTGIVADPWDIPLDGVLTENGLEAFSERLRDYLAYLAAG
jgi:5-formyltetrahydrofolate cyclo-ligase